MFPPFDGLVFVLMGFLKDRGVFTWLDILRMFLVYLPWFVPYLGKADVTVGDDCYGCEFAMVCSLF